MKKFSEQSRREFFRRTSCAAIGAAAASAGFRKLGLMNLYAQDAVAQSTAAAGLQGPRLHLHERRQRLTQHGGAARHDSLQSVRCASGRGPDLAIPLANLLPLNPIPIGNFGLHPAMPELEALFNLNKLAVVNNVGPLVQPTTRTTYQNGSAKRPYQLFSHSDQVQIWQTSDAQNRTQSGWGGLLADKIKVLNTSSFPVLTSVAGSSVFGQGLSTRQLSISSGTALNQVLVLNGFNATPESVARRNAFDFLRTIDRSATLVAAASDGTQESIDIMGDITFDPTLTTVFPNSGLGNQLKQIAKVIKLNQTTPSLNLQRQIFFAAIGGFDTHQNELGSHTNLYGQLSKAMNAFYNATIELGVSTQVTTFTLSDFGRTLSPSGSGAGTVGTDHGWGSHHFVMGGSVKGGAFYGIPGSNGTPFPTLVLAGPDDADNRGRLIPTTSVDQYAATLGKWFGLQPADYPYVFPLLTNFAANDIGFMM